MSGERDRLAAALPAYDIGPELGRGGFGVVVEGRHRQLGRSVAIKQLPRSFGEDPDVRARFLAEARILATLDHPHVVPIFDYVEADGVCLLVMEKLAGGTLWERFSTKGLAPQTACAAILATCAGLQCAHEQGILHRDIKPENLIFSSAGTLKVTDFGISKMLSGTTTKATAAGEILGTPAYMAPEQAESGELTPGTDVYAVGVMLYELLSGHLPFSEDDGLVALLYKRVHEDAPALEAVADVPLPLADVTMQALERDRDERYATAEELGVAVAEAATNVWGPGWLQSADLPVLAATEMIAVTERASGAGRASAARTKPTARAGKTKTPARAAAPTPVVRPTITGHAVGARASDIRPMELVPASEVLAGPGPPIPQMATALGLLIIAVVLAFVGLGSPSHSGNVQEGTVLLNDVDVVTAPSVELDLSKPIALKGIIPALHGGTNNVELSFSAAGIPLGSAKATIAPNAGVYQTTIDASASRFLLPAKATAKVAVKEGDRAIADRTFEVKSASGGLLSAPTAVTLVLALFALAYSESLLRGLRRGRRTASATVGVAITGALVGVAAVLAAWVTGVKVPVPATVVACAVVGAGGGIAAALAAARVGRRRRARRR